MSQRVHNTHFWKLLDLTFISKADTSEKSLRKELRYELRHISDIAQAHYKPNKFSFGSYCYLQSSLF